MENQPEITATTISTKTATTIRNFLTVGKAEGYSFLILLFIAMPLKYVFHHPEYVRFAGSLHGILFISFMYTIFRMLKQNVFETKKAAYAFLLSLLPFGTFFLRKLI